jgi:hypothetical protein
VRVGVSMIFRWRHGSVMRRPWCELKVVSQWTLGFCGAELWWGGGGGWKYWLFGGDGG